MSAPQLKCRCTGYRRYYVAHCPNRANHGVWADLPPFDDFIMRDAARYHEEWVGRELEWEPVGRKPKPALGDDEVSAAGWSQRRKEREKDKTTQHVRGYIRVPMTKVVKTRT